MTAPGRPVTPRPDMLDRLRGRLLELEARNRQLELDNRRQHVELLERDRERSAERAATDERLRDALEELAYHAERARQLEADVAELEAREELRRRDDELEECFRTVDRFRAALEHFAGELGEGALMSHNATNPGPRP